MQEGLRITVEDLHIWRGDQEVLSGVAFSAAGGDLVHITGANGAGKTTLLRILCGLTAPEEGQIRWQGPGSAAGEQDSLPALVFFGHKDGISDELSVSENLHYGLSLMGCAASDASVREVLDELSIGHKAEMPCKTLSAGQRRRVALARIFLCDAAVWLLDEPYTHLDGQGRATLNTKIMRNVNAGGMVMLTTHEASLLPRAVALEVVL